MKYLLLILALLIPQMASAGEDSDVSDLQKKLYNIIIPKVDLEDMTVEECVDVLRLRAIDCNPEPDGGRKGINFVIINPPSFNTRVDDNARVDEGKLLVQGRTGDLGMIPIDELRLTDVSLQTVLRYMCAKTHLSFLVEKHAVIIFFRGEDPLSGLPADTP